MLDALVRFLQLGSLLFLLEKKERRDTRGTRAPIFLSKELSGSQMLQGSGSYK
jgi:hypothetical protein